MKGIRGKEILCIIVLLLFIFIITDQNKISDSPAKEVFQKVCASVDVKDLSKSKKEKFKKEFGFSTNEFENVYYMSSDSIMDVREILVVKFKKTSPTDELIESIKKRAHDKETLFKGYAPEQSDMLEKYVLEKKGGFVFFAVSETPRQALYAFRNAL